MYIIIHHDESIQYDYIQKTKKHSTMTNFVLQSTHSLIFRHTQSTMVKGVPRYECPCCGQPITSSSGLLQHMWLKKECAQYYLEQFMDAQAKQASKYRRLDNEKEPTWLTNELPRSENNNDICQPCDDVDEDVADLEITPNDNYPRDEGAAGMLDGRLEEALQQALNEQLVDEDININPNIINQPVILTEELANYFGYKKQLFTRTERTQIHLLKLLQEMRCPLYAYNKIMNWAKTAATDGYNFADPFPSRDAVISALESKYNKKKMQPEPFETVHLGQENKEGVPPICKNVWWNFKDQLLDLLNDPKLMQLSNLSVDPNNPFAGPYTPPGEGVGEVHSAKWYYDTHQELIVNPGRKNALVIGIILFIDATTIDTRGKFKLEPVSMSLSIFNQSTRNHAHAWRPLGFLGSIPMSSAENDTNVRRNKDINVRNWHRNLYRILEPLIQLQQQGGFKHPLKLGNEIRYTTILTPVAYFIGDMEGQHKLCGHYKGSKNVQRLTRNCNVSFEQSDNENFCCCCLSTEERKEILWRNDRDELKKYSMRSHTSALDAVDFGSNPYGLSLATPNDIMHMFDHGIVNYVLKYLFEDVLTDTVKANVDIIAINIEQQSKQGARRVLPRMNFPNGITQLCMAHHSEKIGVLLMLLLVFTSKDGREAVLKCCNIENDLEVDVWVMLFELLLVLHDYLHGNTFWKYRVDGRHSPKQNQFQEKIRTCMRVLKTIVKRDKHGWKLRKFHELLHLGDQITYFGRPCNYDSSRCETHHIAMCKIPAEVAQKRHSCFLVQVGKRLSQFTLVSKAFEHACKSVGKKKKVDNECFSGVPHTSSSYAVSRQVMQYEYEQERIVITWKNKKNLGQVEPALKCFIYKSFLKNQPVNHVICHTEYKRDNVLYCAHPFYQNNHQKWEDWVKVLFEVNEEEMDYIACLCCFVEMPRANKFGHKEGLYAIVHCVEKQCNEEDSTVLTQQWIMEKEHRSIDPKLTIVSVESLNDHVFVVHNYMENNREVVLKVKTRDKWIEEF